MQGYTCPKACRGIRVQKRAGVYVFKSVQGYTGSKAELRRILDENSVSGYAQYKRWPTRNPAGKLLYASYVNANVFPHGENVGN